MHSPALAAWTFYNEPHIVPRESYARSQQEFVTSMMEVPGVDAIYRFGSVGYPGLSDLDFVIVLPDGASRADPNSFLIDRFSDETRYILYHPQFVVSRTSFSDLEWLVPVFELEWVAGAQLHNRSPAANTERSLTFLVQSLLTDFAWAILGSAQRRLVDVRMAQAKLNLVSRNLSMLEQATGMQPSDAPEFKARVHELRSTWFEGTSDSTRLLLKETLLDACGVVADISEILSNFLQDNFAFESSAAGNRRWAFNYIDTRSIFCRNSSRITVRNGSLTPLSLEVPYGLLAPLAVGCGLEGLASRYLRYQFNEVPRIVAAGNLKSMARIAEAANVQAAFLRRLRIRSGAFNYFGYRPNFRPGVRSIARRAAGRVRGLLRTQTSKS